MKIRLELQRFTVELEEDDHSEFNEENWEKLGYLLGGALIAADHHCSGIVYAIARAIEYLRDCGYMEGHPDANMAIDEMITGADEILRIYKTLLPKHASVQHG